MKVKFLLNLSTSDFPPPDGEGPYLEGQERVLKDSLAKAAIARGWAVAKSAPPPSAPVAESARDEIVACEVLEEPPAKPRRGR